MLEFFSILSHLTGKKPAQNTIFRGIITIPSTLPPWHLFPSKIPVWGWKEQDCLWFWWIPAAPGHFCSLPSSAAETDTRLSGSPGDVPWRVVITLLRSLNTQMGALSTHSHLILFFFFFFWGVEKCCPGFVLMWRNLFWQIALIQSSA